MPLPLLLGLGAAAGVGKELFSYNRENFKFDQKQHIERECLRLDMQLKRFQLFREDIRDLVKLTVDRMDVYHLVGSLFLQFVITMLTKGRVQASAPPFLLSLFMLSNVSTFIYLLLAVWMSMHASIASHSFGVRLLTRFVRLPIPSIRQIKALTFKLNDFEKESMGNLLRLPFQDRQQHWDTVEKDGGAPASASTEEAGNLRAAASAQDIVPPGAGLGLGGSDALPGAAAAICPRRAERLLPEVDDQVWGGDGLLSGKGGLPERHVQLFRQLQTKWQCYDAYCRVCMGLGVNQMLQVLSYYSICHTLVENHSPSTGFALVMLFQCATVALAVLDLAGMRRREIIIIQLVGVIPCLFTAGSVSMGSRDEDDGALDPDENYPLSPFSFFFTACWLELWLRISAPSQDQAKLPRRFRQVLFLDVFGDATGWDPSQADGMTPDDMLERRLRDDEMEASAAAAEATQAGELLESECRKASSQLLLAQAAVRRWRAVPSWAGSDAQRKELARLQGKLQNWGNTIKSELELCSSLLRARGLPSLSSSMKVFEASLRPWSALSAEEQAADPFSGTLMGPFRHDGVQAPYYYDIEGEQPLFEDTLDRASRPGALELSLQAVEALLEDLERDARALLEARITSDLRIESRRLRQAAAITRRREVPLATTVATVEEKVPNLLSLAQDPRPKGNARRPSSQDGTGIAPQQPEPSADPIAEAATEGQGGRPSSADPTLVAIAGKDAQHFVPERLPWLILSRMTRVLQACWLWASFMAFLKVGKIYEVDFGLVEVEAGDELPIARRLCTSRPWSFQPVDVDWPHRHFFRPQGLFCPQTENSELVIGSPFALYAVTPDSDGGRPLQLEEAATARMPVSTITLCEPVAMSEWEIRPSIKACHLMAAIPGGLVLWPVGEDYHGPKATTLPLEGANWSSLAGAIVGCGNLTQLVPSREVAMATWCLTVVGWDEQAGGLPVAVVPLPAGGLAQLSISRATPQVVPAVVAPLGGAKKKVRALHLEPSRARLWALLTDRRLEAWDLPGARSLGRWTPEWPHSSGRALQPVALCEEPGRGLLALGRSDEGPVLLHADLPGPLSKARAGMLDALRVSTFTQLGLLWPG